MNDTMIAMIEILIAPTLLFISSLFILQLRKDCTIQHTAFRHQI